MEQVAKDEAVLAEGRRQDHLYFVIAGTLHAVHNEGTERTLLGRIMAGQWFGEVNMFDPEKASATVEARSYAQLWRISRQALEEFLNNYPNPGARLLLSIAGLLARRIRELDQRLDTATRRTSAAARA